MARSTPVGSRTTVSLDGTSSSRGAAFITSVTPDVVDCGVRSFDDDGPDLTGSKSSLPTICGITPKIIEFHELQSTTSLVVP